jgi:glycosyltransferase involved in cell wall biosynthesis
LWLRYLTALGRAVTVIYVVHNEPEPLFGSQVRILRRLARGHSLKFVAHSPAIAEHVSQYLGLQPRVIALPFKPPDFIERPPARNRPIRFAFLGLGHRSKGLDLVLQAVELSADLLEANRLEFTIQCYLPFRDSTSERLHRDAKELSVKVAGIQLIDRELSPPEYVMELKRADIVLVPHRLDTYKFALSGVFADAMGAGRPVIVAEGTYMSELVRESGAGVTFEAGNGVSLQRAIVEAAGSVDQLLHRAKAARERWILEQGPEAFVTRLLQLHEPPVATRSA